MSLHSRSRNDRRQRSRSSSRERKHRRTEDYDRSKSRDHGRSRERDHRDERSRRDDRDNRHHRSRDRRGSDEEATNGSVDRHRSTDSKKRSDSDHRGSESSDRVKFDGVPDSKDVVDGGVDDDEFEFEDEEAKVARLALERKLRKQAILEKHKNASVPSAAAVAAPTETAMGVDKDESSNNGDGGGRVEEHVEAVEAAKTTGAEFDMFNLAASNSPATRTEAVVTADAAVVGEGPQSNWDDADGYYKERIGEMVGGRYRVCGTVGRGVFSTVLKCDDIQTGLSVAVKMIRNNDTMRRAAAKELDLLREICGDGPDTENKRFCVQLLSHMEHRNHTALVFEALHMNLRDTQRKFGGKNVGLNINGVRRYAQQMLMALRHLRSLSIVHADLKPDNILVNESFTILKLCDFGSAFKADAADNDITPYLVSRFYRAPEIELGLPYGCPIDVWAVGTCLYELFTGRVMFPGRDNNDMLRLQMEVKGAFPVKMLKKHRASYDNLMLEHHFTEDNKFVQHETDPVTGSDVVRLVTITKPTRDLRSELLSNRHDGDKKSIVVQLADILEKMLVLDPARRPTPTELLRHPLFGPHKKEGSRAGAGDGATGGN